MIFVRGFLGPKGPRPRSDDGGLREKAPAGPRRDADRAFPGGLGRWLRGAPAREPVPSYTGPVENPEPGKAGICCSGGGIRSAAFSLGALQLLQEAGELRRASYLAAVSGGSYIAAAISMVNKTGPQGPDVESPRNSDPTLLRGAGAFAPNSPEEQYLRNRSSYLAPTLMEKLYLGWRVVLGLLFNLAFVSMPLIGVALVLTGILYAPALSELAGACGQAASQSAAATANAATTAKQSCTLHLPTWSRSAPLVALGFAALSGLISLLTRSPKEAVGRIWAVWATRLLIAAAVLALVLVAIPYLVDRIRDFGDGGDSTGSLASSAASKFGAGTVALLVGVVTQLGHLLSSQEAVEELGRTRKAFGRLGTAARVAVTFVAGGLIGPLLLLGVVVLTVAAAMSEVSGGFEPGLVGLGVAVLAIFAVLYFFVDLTTWSLHPFYKRRLASVFALKRVRVDGLNDKELHRVEALDEGVPGSEGGVAIERDYDELVPISKTALTERGPDCEWPTLLVCAAANVSDAGATPPGRRVTSFTFSANSVGGPLVGAVGMTDLEGAFEAGGDRKAARGGLGKVATWIKERIRGGQRRSRDLTLPATIAMSGAAISPSMGKMTKRSLTFLMALANIRLGVWVPSPRRVKELEEDDGGGWRRMLYARPRPWYLLCELLGLNRVRGRYLYVTDGGHYENLGLVELLRRGCTEVYCLDASGVGEGKGEFEALGDAIALARSELGVEIEFAAEPRDHEDGEEDEPVGTDPDELVPDEKTRMAERDVVIGKIVYPVGGPDGEPLMGKLVYVRNTMTAKAPWDVRAHQKADPRFPNNPTIDQLYTDQKFESYRALGALAGANAFEAMKQPVPG